MRLRNYKIFVDFYQFSRTQKKNRAGTNWCHDQTSSARKFMWNHSTLLAGHELIWTPMIPSMLIQREDEKEEEANSPGDSAMLSDRDTFAAWWDNATADLWLEPFPEEKESWEIKEFFAMWMRSKIVRRDAKIFLRRWSFDDEIEKRHKTCEFE